MTSAKLFFGQNVRISETAGGLSGPFLRQSFTIKVYLDHTGPTRNLIRDQSIHRHDSYRQRMTKVKHI